MAKYPGRKGDLRWGRFDYPVTPSQKETLDGIWFMMSGLPRAYSSGDLPESGFYSQNVHDGGVIIGLHHRSVTVHRSGRVTPNIGAVDIPGDATSPVALRRARELLSE